jgi:hypothetical protein
MIGACARLHFLLVVGRGGQGESEKRILRVWSIFEVGGARHISMVDIYFGLGVFANPALISC